MSYRILNLRDNQNQQALSRATVAKLLIDNYPPTEDNDTLMQAVHELLYLILQHHYTLTSGKRLLPLIQGINDYRIFCGPRIEI